MARVFNGVNQWLRVATCPVVAPPFTLACWFRCNNLLLLQDLMCLNSAGRFELTAYGTGVGDPLRAYTRGAGASGAYTTSGYTANTWHHGCGVFAATNDRRCYIDGGSKGVDVGNQNPVGALTAAIGANFTGGSLLTGAVAEAAIWNVALTDDEVAALGAGYSPLAVSPAALVAYWPLGGLYGTNDGDHDVVGAYNMTPQNAPTTLDSPPIIYPISPIAVPWLIAVGNPWYAYAQQ